MNAVTEALVERCSLSGEIRPKRRGHRFFAVSHLPPHRTMNLFLKRRFIKRICVGTFILALVCFLLIFVGVPVVFRYSYSVQCNLLFLNFVNIPNVDFKKPTSLGLIGARNLHIITSDKVKIGAWHILPLKHQLEAVAHSWLSSDNGHKQYDRWMQEEVTIIYCHGNAGNRASDHRVHLYKILNQLNYHVVAFDYRGYADSSSRATDEQGVVEDTKAVITWVQERVTNGSIFIWGHSLGTGVASHALAELETEGKRVSGILLEAPFNNLSDEVREYPFSQIFKHLPWFDFFIIDPMYENNLRFESDKNLQNVSAPILILHAEDDRVVPYKLGQKLYNTLMDYRKDDSSVQLVTFESKLRLGHKFIYRDKRIPYIVKKFVDRNLRKNHTTVSSKSE